MKGVFLVDIILLIFLVVFAAIYLLIGPYLHMITGPVAVIEIVVKPEYFPVLADHALISLLEVTDENTGKSIQELLAIAVSEGSKSITVDGETVDLESIIDEEMEFMLPDKNYRLLAGYLEFGKQDLGLEQFSVTEIRLSNLRKEDVYLYIS
jgi:hypothetical protein